MPSEPPESGNAPTGRGVEVIGGLEVVRHPLARGKCRIVAAAGANRYDGFIPPGNGALVAGPEAGPDPWRHRWYAGAGLRRSPFTRVPSSRGVASPRPARPIMR